MPLDGAAFAAQADAFLAFAQGDTPDSMLPVLGGDAVVFLHDTRKANSVAQPTGGRTMSDMIVFVRGALPLNTKYTWGGSTWILLECKPDRAAGAAWPFMAVLTRHV